MHLSGNRFHLIDNVAGRAVHAGVDRIRRFNHLGRGVSHMLARKRDGAFKPVIDTSRYFRQLVRHAGIGGLQLGIDAGGSFLQLRGEIA